MEDSSLSIADPDKSLVIWDFIEGGKNADQYEQHISEATNRNRRIRGYLITSNVDMKPIEIVKNTGMTIREVIEQYFGAYLATHSYKILRNGRLLKDSQKLNEFEKGSTIQLFLLKIQSEEILEEKPSELNSNSSRFDNSELHDNKVTIDDDIEAVDVDEEQFELGFNVFENTMSVN